MVKKRGRQGKKCSHKYSLFHSLLTVIFYLFRHLTLFEARKILLLTTSSFFLFSSYPPPPFFSFSSSIFFFSVSRPLGRSKEIINRGGETISPFEIEEAVQQHPSVKEVLAFSAPHEQVLHCPRLIFVS